MEGPDEASELPVETTDTREEENQEPEEEIPVIDEPEPVTAPVFVTSPTHTVEEAAQAMDYFRSEVRKAGFPGLHLQLTPGGGSDPTPQRSEKMRYNIELLGINSIAFYNMGGFDCDYITHNENAVRMRNNTDAAYEIPLFPTVSVGWDDTPRFPEKGENQVTRWHNTPESFAGFLTAAKE